MAKVVQNLLAGFMADCKRARCDSNPPRACWRAVSYKSTATVGYAHPLVFPQFAHL